MLSRGLIGGHFTKNAPPPKGDFRAMSPRFQGENYVANLAPVEALRAVATRLDASLAQIAIAWVASRGDDIVPLIGARTRNRLEEALGALDLQLSENDLAAIEAAVPKGAAAGARHPEAAMRDLDSERQLSRRER
jgi:aryl-alcohol dehydrogenase-like predicted oxidoreductase